MNQDTLGVPKFVAPPPRNTLKPGATTPSAASATGNPRNKTALKPGRSLMDWVRLGSTTDLSGTGGKHIQVTPSELMKHNKEDDAWLAIRGQVYNVTPYMEYHPGGIDELMRGVGQDATVLFDEVHNWVNYRSMLAKCLIGPLVGEPRASKPQSSAGPRKVPINRMPRSGFESSSDESAINVNIMHSLSTIPPSLKEKPPNTDWFQTDTTVSIVVYTRWLKMTKERVVLEKLENKQLKVMMRLEERTYVATFQFSHDFDEHFMIGVSRRNGKVSIDIEKARHGERWAYVKVGEETGGIVFTPTHELETAFRQCTVTHVTDVNYNTKLFRVELPHNVCMRVSIGHHVMLQRQVLAMNLTCPYTVVTESLLRMGDDQANGRCFYLMIKLYENGAITPSLHQLEPGNPLDVSTFPEGSFDHDVLDDVTFLTLFAAGTGFTPMIRVLQYVLVTSAAAVAKTTVRFVFFNRSVDDILWRDQLEAAVAKYPNFQLYHVLSEPPSDWPGWTGRVRAELVKQFVPGVGGVQGKCFFCTCGPLPFTNECVRLVKAHGYVGHQIHAFT